MDLDTGDMLRVVRATTRTVDHEYTDSLLPVEGTLPPALDGVLFRNGPARFERGGRAYGHPFDGDGHVLRIELGGGAARYSNRFVRTPEYVAEERAGRMLHRAFGTNLPGGLTANLFRLRIKNTANTSVIWHGGRLLALWEAGAPYRLDPRTLDTIGSEDFGGRLRNPFDRLSRMVLPLLPFSAHPRIDPISGDLINFGLVAGIRNRLLIYRVDRHGQMGPWQEHHLPRFSFVHDVAITRRWICLLLPFADYDVARSALGLATPVGSLSIDRTRPMQALLLPREPSGTGVHLLPRIDCGTGFVFHIAQAFDRDDGALVLDAVRYGHFPDFDRFEDLFRRPDPGNVPHLERIVLDPAAGRAEITRWGPWAFELPTADARIPLGEPHRILYGNGAPENRFTPFLTSVQRLDTETGALVSRDLGLDLVGEPIPAPDPDGSEGWLLCPVYRAGPQRVELLVLRAADLATIATLRLPHPVPLGFHGCWVPRAALT